MAYRCETASVAGFVQQLAVSYLGNGYWFYVTGFVPEGKNPKGVDEKLIERYGIDISKWARARRKQAGLANVHYIRHRQFFVLLATHGKHLFFEMESKSLRDARRTPIRFAGYSVSYRGGHPHVRIEQEEYKWLKAYYTERAVHRTTAHLTDEFHQLPFEPYAPVRRQMLNILREVNRRRKQARMERVPVECLRLRRRIYKPFG